MKLIRLTAQLSLLFAAGCAYQNPTPTAPAAIDPLAPSQITLSALPGDGAAGGSAIVTARVQNANGTSIPNVLVSFTTTRGNVTPAQVSTNAGGTATARLAASDTADVTASAGTISAHTLVIATGAANPTPTTPSVALASLNVSGSATTCVAVPFGVSSTATGVTWFWSFGDGANEQSNAFTTTHTYTRAGTYTASVSSASTTSSSATITVTDPPVTTPAPTTGAFGVTMGCPTAAALVQSCNVAVSFNGAPAPSSTISNVTWDWGDGQTDRNQTSPVMSHTYASAGTYTVFASVTAALPLGASQTATTSQSVTVK